MNSKAEYSRCRVPHLTVDLEGWNNSKKVEVVPQLMAQGQVDLQTMDEDMVREAEVNLGERDMKRKNKHPPSMRKSKIRRLEKLTGWGESFIQQKMYPTFRKIYPSARRIYPASRKICPPFRKIFNFKMVS